MKNSLILIFRFVKNAEDLERELYDMVIYDSYFWDCVTDPLNSKLDGYYYYCEIFDYVKHIKYLGEVLTYIATKEL